MDTDPKPAPEPTAVRTALWRALHLEVDRHNPIARALYAKLGFKLREKFSLMSLKL